MDKERALTLANEMNDSGITYAAVVEPRRNEEYEGYGITFWPSSLDHKHFEWLMKLCEGYGLELEFDNRDEGAGDFFLFQPRPEPKEETIEVPGPPMGTHSITVEVKMPIPGVPDSAGNVFSEDAVKQLKQAWKEMMVEGKVFNLSYDHFDNRFHPLNTHWNSAGWGYEPSRSRGPFSAYDPAMDDYATGREDLEEIPTPPPPPIKFDPDPA